MVIELGEDPSQLSEFSDFCASEPVRCVFVRSIIDLTVNLIDSIDVSTWQVFILSVAIARIELLSSRAPLKSVSIYANGLQVAKS